MIPIDKSATSGDRSHAWQPTHRSKTSWRRFDRSAIMCSLLLIFPGFMMTPSADNQRPTRIHGLQMGGLFALGFVTDFLDTLGVGSFATTTSVLRLGRVVDDEKIPGTLNIGHAIPTILEAALFLTAVPVDPLTFATMVTTGGLGAWLGTGTMVHWPRRTIQRAMAMVLMITAILIVLRQIDLFPPSGGTAIGLTGPALVIVALASTLIGSLTSLGIGNYAPTMAVTYMLGMDPKSVFPIMAASASLILPTAAVRFFRSGRFDRRTALGLALGGVPGVLIAVFVVKELNVDLLRWLVVAVLLYTSVTLYRSSRVTEPRSNPADPGRASSGVSSAGAIGSDDGR
jgi:uncharacterized membrane protein YfcA